MNYQIRPIPALKDNYIWLLVNLDNHQALAVDPGEAAPVIAYLEAQQLTLTDILVTHHHGDHTHGLAELKAKYATAIYGSIDNQHSSITHRIEQGQSFDLPHLKLTFQGIAVPGHTIDHMAFYSQPYVFTGDTLFSAGCGRLFEGTPEQMWASLQKLMALPEDTQIFCGHEYTLSNLKFAMLIEPDNQAVTTYFNKVEQLREQGLPSLPSTLRLEKRVNPFLRVMVPDVIQAASAYANQSLAEPWQVFAALRAWKNAI